MTVQSKLANIASCAVSSIVSSGSIYLLIQKLNIFDNNFDVDQRFDVQTVSMLRTLCKIMLAYLSLDSVRLLRIKSYHRSFHHLISIIPILMHLKYNKCHKFAASYMAMETSTVFLSLFHLKSFYPLLQKQTGLIRYIWIGTFGLFRILFNTYLQTHVMVQGVGKHSKYKDLIKWIIPLSSTFYFLNMYWFLIIINKLVNKTN